MNLIKTSLFSGIATVIKILAGFVINKMMALYVGPSGLAIVGQLRNFSDMVTVISNGATTQGVIKYTAEYKSEKEKQKLFSTSISVSLICSFVISLLLLFFHLQLSCKILNSADYASVFIIFGLTIFFFALNSNLMAILNGQKEIKKYITINIISSLFSLVFTSFLIFVFGLIGALYAIVINQSAIFFVTLYFIIKSPWFCWHYFNQGIDKENLRRLGGYSLMAITSAVTGPISQILIRNHIGDTLGWDAAGYWQGIWYISSVYLMVVTTPLALYYLPRLSEIIDNHELRKEIFNGYIVIIPIVSILALIIYFSKGIIIHIAFTNKFIPMLPLFKWQLIGDVIKIVSWLLSYLLLAKAMTKLFIYTEIAFSISFVILSILFVNIFGLIGVTYAFSLNYSLYLIVMIVMFRKRFV